MCSMRYVAFATDYDGTLAHDGLVSPKTLEALARLRKSGRTLLLVTGREMKDLERVFPHVAAFDLVIAENGAVLHDPKTGNTRTLAEPPPEPFVAALRARGVQPLSVGSVIVATWEPQEVKVFEAIRDLGLELQVIFNKSAVMVLPAGVNKATGLAAALQELRLSCHNVVAIGDAENDHAFLKASELSVAVSNALPSVKDEADLVAAGDHGDGVVEVIEQLIASDLQEVNHRQSRHDLLIGHREDGSEVRVHPSGVHILLAGTSGGGKSTLTTALLERLAEAGRQFCVIDPEGDYHRFEGAVVLGDAEKPPAFNEAMSVLDHPAQNVILNLLGVPLEERPKFLEALLPRIHVLRVRTGRPHWVVADEALHMIQDFSRTGELFIRELSSSMLVTLKPGDLTDGVLAATTLLIAVGEQPSDVFGEFCARRGMDLPMLPRTTLERGEAIVWEPDSALPPYLMKIAPGHADRVRHSRKYASGELSPERSFYFRGPDGQLNLRAQNLMTFIQLLQGVDDETWLFHLRQGEYSQWFRQEIKNEELALDAESVERETALTPMASRARIEEAIRSRYTKPG